MKKITRQRQKSGDILQIYIDDFGYIYFKIIDILKFNPECSYQYLIRIFKDVYKEPLSEITQLNRDLLIAPIVIGGYNGLMKSLELIIISNEDIFENEKILPDVKRGEPINIYGYDHSKYSKWTVLRELGDTRNTYFTTLEKVKHLEWSGAINITGIPFRIKLELLKLQGKDIKVECGLKDWHEELIYEMAIDLPVYSNLDPKTRDFAYE
jgi:hypothetical protein